MKPFYRLSDFTITNPLTKGKTWTAECPVCGKKHLRINRTSGLFHCFTPGCNFGGILDEYKELKYQHNVLGERYCDASTKTTPSHRQAPSRVSESQALPVLPSDYPQLSPSTITKLQPIDTMPQVVHYLEQQKIPVETALALGCYAATVTCQGKEEQKYTGPCLAYVTTVYGNIVNIKYRNVAEKVFTQDVLDDKTLPAPPYGIDCLNPVIDDTPTKILYITEGEKDVLTLHACGYRYVISPPNGSGSKPETCMDPFAEWFDLVEHVVICGDNDRAGRVMKRNFTAYFESMGKSVSIAQLPYGTKDISDVHQQFGLDTVKSILDPISVVTNPECIRVSDDRQGIREVLMGHFDHGYSIGYGPHTDRHFMLTGEGGLIVVTGRPNHGKTDWMRSTLTRLILQQDKKVCFLSFEEPNKRKHVRRIVEVAFDTNHTEDIPSKLQDDILDTLDQRIVNLHLTFTAPTPTNIIRQCNRLQRQGFAMDFLYIDPYLFIQSEDASESETQQIKHILTILQGWAREHHIWVIVVAHPRKLIKDGTSEFEEVDEYTISGSAHWANLADYLLSVKRTFPGGITDAGSQSPSFTVVNMLKVRDQTICHTGRMYFLRHPSGRYEERPDEATCKLHLTHTTPPYEDCEAWIIKGS